jgi:hypothetical protein
MCKQDGIPLDGPFATGHEVSGTESMSAPGRPLSTFVGPVLRVWHTVKNV